MTDAALKGLARRARIFAIATVAGVAGLAACAGQGLAADDVFATINGSVLTRAQFVDTLEARYGHDVLADIIAETVIKQAELQNHVIVPVEKIDAEVARVQSQFQTEQEFTNALVQNRLTMEGFRDQTRLRLVLEQLGAPDAPTEQQLKEYFQDNRVKYDQGDEVNVRHILVKTEDEAKAIVAQLSSGGDFAKLAADNSLDPGSKDNGGEVGYVKKGQLVPEFEAVAFALKPGETSGPVKTDYGYHIIRFIDHRLPQEADYEAVRDRVIVDYKQDFSSRPEDVLQGLTEQAVIKINSDRYKGLENIPAPVEAAPAPVIAPPAEEKKP